MKNVLFPALSAPHSGMILFAKAGEEGSGEATASEAKLPGRKVFTEETIAEIRALRAEKREDGKPLHSHAALAKQFETTAGAISHIVRNRTYKNPNYVPTNDGV